MAVNIYGSCTGSSGSKYNLWLNVVQNSQSLDDNKSNVTVRLRLKRNDGYSDSAYNLNEDSNTAVLKVGGKEKVNKNLAIDTRDGKTVTLASWTGDVTHTDDGSLSLSLSGSFSMGGTSLSGGSVSGKFNCTDIPRASTLTLSKSSVNPLESVGATITMASSGFSHKIKWSLGDSSVTHTLSAGVELDAFTVPVSWAEEITASKSGKLKVAITTYKNSKKIGSKSYSLNLVIPATAEFLPEFDLVTERIDDSVPVSIGEYIKGKNRIKLNISNLNLKHGATAAAYTAKLGTVSKTKLPAVFDLTKSGEIKVSVTVKDSRGFSVTKSSKINVLNYSAPTISVKSLYRCDGNGNKTTSGTYLLAELTTKYSSLDNKNIPGITYKYKKADGGIYSGEIAVNGSPAILGNGEFLSTASYKLAFKITDSITKENDFVEAFVSSATIPFNIRNGGKGAAFGCYSERDNELAVGWDLNVKGGLVYEDADISLSDFIESKLGVARYIPCMEIVFVRLRFTAAQTIAGGENHILATFTKRISALLTPLTVMVNNGISNKCTGFIRSGTGDIIFSSQNDIKAGDYIYVSGFYYSYRE